MADERPRVESTGREFDGPQGLDAVPGLARIALSAWLHTTEWTLKNSLKLPGLVVETARSPQKTMERLRELGAYLPDPTATSSAPEGDAEKSGGAHTNGQGHEQEHERVMRSLREDGETLLRRSRDVRYDVDSHPAYERIMEEIAPDEARILRLLLVEGPQPAIDVRVGGLLGRLRSDLVAAGLSMIGARAGCRYLERVPPYLNNLSRLGMVWFSGDQLRDPLRYQVLEAQPEVTEATNRVRRAKLVRRSIHLTPFGEDFCRVCLAAEDEDLQNLPAHSTPSAASADARPAADALTEDEG